MNHEDGWASEMISMAWGMTPEASEMASLASEMISEGRHVPSQGGVDECCGLRRWCGVALVVLWFDC